MSEPSKLRLRFETVGSIVAIVVGVAALWVSWDQGQVMRDEMRASVWPALQVDGFTDTAGGDLNVGLSLENAGVGPALIERVTLRRNGELVADLDALRAMVAEGLDGQTAEDLNVSFQSATGRILAAGARIRPFEFHFESAADFPLENEFALSAGSGRVTTAWSVEVCYCSSLGDCWATGTDISPPTSVNRCDAEPASTF